MTDTLHKLLPNRTMPSCSIIPVLAYPDLDKTITWLCETFGFRERWRVGSHRAQLSYGEGTIAITEIHESMELHSTTGFSLLVRVPDARLHYEHTLQKGAKILHPPTDYPFGERQYTVADIGGHIWTFSQSIADLLPEDWGGSTAK